MKNLMMVLIVLVSICSTSMEAQNIWIGGTIAHESEWNDAKNRSNNRVPDWTEDVIIKDVSSNSGYFPIIDSKVEPIAHFEIQSNAELTIQRNGDLVVDGISTFNIGITLIGNIDLDGNLEIKNTALNSLENLSGKLLVDKKMIAFLDDK